uniref:Argininosuccinate lyase n=1 Tax=Fervidicoccus fontis TaxID=683846 RepID=A0A7J3ZII8_9CREN
MYRKAGFKEADEKITEYTSSITLDREILEETLLVLISHTLHLVERRVIPLDAGRRIVRTLLELYLRREDLEWSRTYEDIHEAVEAYLTKKLGEEAGYASLGRSRNDHVAAVLRLKLARSLIALAKEVIALRETLIRRAKEHAGEVFVLHTHFQPAQTITFGHYLLSIEEELSDIIDMMIEDVELVLKSPLGAAAGAGTSVPIDRRVLALQTGFKDVVINSVYATSSRTFFIRALSPILSLAVLYSRISTDFYLWSHPSLSLVTPPETHVQTSSIMPHKRNPASLEVVRARCIDVVGEFFNVIAIESKLPTGYSLDLQEITKHVWNSINTIREATLILGDFLAKVKPNMQVSFEVARRFISGATEVAERIAISKREPFRKVHAKVSSTLRKVDWNIERAIEVLSSEYGEGLKHLIDPVSQVNTKVTLGSTGPTALLESIEAATYRVKKHRERLDGIAQDLEGRLDMLVERARALIAE